jgi:hypothetical protein
VSLIRALGGGWTVQVLPDERQALQFTESDYGVPATADSKSRTDAR